MRTCHALWTGMAAVLCAASRLVAADGTWVNTVGGNWADAGNWQDGTVAGGAGATAYFSDAPASHLIVTLPPEGVTLRKLSHRQQATTGNTLFRGGPFLLDGDAPEIFAPEGYYLDLASDLQGNSGLTWNGGGVLCTDTSYTGPTILNSGTLHDHMWYGVSTDSTSISNHLSTGPLVLNGAELDMNGRPNKPASSSTWLLTDGDRVVRKVADALAAAAGASVTGEGIQNGTFVKQFIDATSFELSLPATSSGEKLLSFGAVTGSESHQRFDRIEVNKNSVLMVNLNGGSVARVQADDLTGGAYTLTKTWDGTFALKGGSAFNGALSMSGGALELLAQTGGLPTVVSNVNLNTRTVVAVPEPAATATLPNVAANGELVKSGAGGLVLKELSGPETRVTVEGGTLALAAKTFLPSIGLVSGAWFHVDASDPASLTLVEENGRKYVTRWNDVRTNGVFAAAEPGEARPFLDEGFQNGLPVVDFGLASFRNIGWYDYGGYLIWSTDCWTIREGFLVYSDRNEDDDRMMTHGYPFLLGHRGAYQFHRGPSGVLLNGEYSAEALRSGAWTIDGAAVNPVTTRMPSGFHVVSFAANGTVAADNFARDREINERGGQRLAEVLIYTNTLTETERQQVTAYLYNKWVRTKIGILTYAGDGTVEVGEGTDARVGILDIKANVVKTGAGTLTADALQQKGGSLTVEAGQLVLGPTAAPAAAPASFPWLHVDASDPASLTLVEEGGQKYVTQWRDTRANGLYAAAVEGESRPFLREGFQNGKPVVDFGMASYRFLGLYEYGGYLNWSTACWSIREGFLVFSDRTEDADRLAAYGSPFLLGHSWEYQFHRGPGGTLLFGDYANPALISGSWAIDGAAVKAAATALPSGFHVVSFAATGPVAADNFARDRDTNTRGGQRLAEVLIYDRALSQKERRDTEDYLMRKWLGTGAPGYENGTSTVEGGIAFADNAHLTVDGATRDLTVDWLEAGGTLVKDGAGTMSVGTLRGGVTGIDVAGGRLTVACDLEQPWFHVDASDAASLTLAEEGGQTYVTRWSDVRTNGVFAAAAEGEARPYLRAGFQNGRPVVDFGMASYPFLGINDYGGYLLWNTACTTIREGFLVYSDRTEEADRMNAHGWPFLLGHSSGEYQFHRGAGGILMEGSYASAALLNGAWSVDGSAWGTVTATPLPAGFHVVSFAATGPVVADNFARDRTTNIRGGQRLAEVLIYTNTLTADVRQRIQEHLLNKWVSGPQDPRQLTQLRAAAGSVASLPAGVFAVGSLQGSGAVSAARITASAASAGDAAGAVGTLEVSGTLELADGAVVEVDIAPPGNDTIDVIGTLRILQGGTFAVRCEADNPAGLAPAVFTFAAIEGAENLSLWAVTGEVCSRYSVKPRVVGNELQLVFAAKGMILLLR